MLSFQIVTHWEWWFSPNMRGSLVVIVVVALVAAEFASGHPINRCGCCKRSKHHKAKDPCNCNCLTAIQSAPPLPPPCPPPCSCHRCNCNSPCDDLAEFAGCGRVSFHQPLKAPCHDVYGAIDLPPPPSPACCNPCPADAVSLALAVERSHKAQRKVLEENLSFGPMQKPLNGVICKSKKFVPEAGLHALRKEVVELLPCSRFQGLTPEEEAEASMLAALQLQSDFDLDCASDFLEPTLPSYCDIGYVPLPHGCNSAFVSGAPCGCNKPRCNCRY